MQVLFVFFFFGLFFNALEPTRVLRVCVGVAVHVFRSMSVFKMSPRGFCRSVVTNKTSVNLQPCTSCASYINQGIGMCSTASA